MRKGEEMSGMTTYLNATVHWHELIEAAKRIVFFYPENYFCQRDIVDLEMMVVEIRKKLEVRP